MIHKSGRIFLPDVNDDRIVESSSNKMSFLKNHSKSKKVSFINYKYFLPSICTIMRLCKLGKSFALKSTHGILLQGMHAHKVKRQCLNHPGILPMKSHKFRLQNLVQIGGFPSDQNTSHSESLGISSVVPILGNSGMHWRQLLCHLQK